MANIWREPVFDRTYKDVTFALQQIAAWKQGHTHVVDVAVEDNKVIINEGEGHVADDVAVLKTEGVTKVEDNVLVVRMGAVYDLKGCLNISDLTRIEDNISYLADKAIHYMFPVAVTSKEWVKSDLPNANDMKRIAKNIRSLIKGFITPIEAVGTSETMLSYQDINNLELNLHLLKEILDVMENSFIQSGTQKCGTAMRLPIRR